MTEWLDEQEILSDIGRRIRSVSNRWYVKRKSSGRWIQRCWIMCYLVAKDRDAHDCFALKTTHGKHLVEWKRDNAMWTNWTSGVHTVYFEECHIDCDGNKKGQSAREFSVYSTDHPKPDALPAQGTDAENTSQRELHDRACRDPRTWISISISIPILCASAHFCVTEFKNIGAWPWKKQYERRSDSGDFRGKYGLRNVCKLVIIKSRNL